MTMLFGFPGLKNRSSAFVDRLLQVASALKADPNHLLTIMQIESGINPQAANRKDGRIVAVGLIQFIASTAQKLGTSLEALAGMSAAEQLRYVQRYYQPFAGRLGSPGELYMVTFYPAAVGKPDDYVISKKGEKVYDWNSVLDVNKDGILTAGDVRAKANNAYRKYAGLPPVAVKSPTASLVTLLAVGLIGGGGYVLYRERRRQKAA